MPTIIAAKKFRTDDNTFTALATHYEDDFKRDGQLEGSSPLIGNSYIEHHADSVTYSQNDGYVDNPNGSYKGMRVDTGLADNGTYVAYVNVGDPISYYYLIAFMNDTRDGLVGPHTITSNPMNGVNLRITTPTLMHRNVIDPTPIIDIQPNDVVIITANRQGLRFEFSWISPRDRYDYVVSNYNNVAEANVDQLGTDMEIWSNADGTIRHALASQEDLPTDYNGLMARAGLL